MQGRTFANRYAEFVPSHVKEINKKRIRKKKEIK